MRRLFHERTTQKLTVQALETLAVIAYRQPITAAEITEVRGVNTSGVLNTLLERHLIKIVGRKPVVGRPFMRDDEGVPDPVRAERPDRSARRSRTWREALGLEAPLLIERTPSEEMLPLDEPEDEDGRRAGGIDTLINTKDTRTQGSDCFGFSFVCLCVLRV